jgi:hypothetical protein
MLRESKDYKRNKNVIEINFREELRKLEKNKADRQSLIVLYKHFRLLLSQRACLLIVRALMLPREYVYRVVA